MPQYDNSRWERCPDCGYTWPRELHPSSWVVREDGLFEGVMLCPCGHTALLLRLSLVARRTLDLVTARRLSAFTDADLERMTDNLLKITGRVGAHLPATKRRKAGVQRGGE